MKRHLAPLTQTSDLSPVEPPVSRKRKRQRPHRVTATSSKAPIKPDPESKVVIGVIIEQGAAGSSKAQRLLDAHPDGLPTAPVALLAAIQAVYPCVRCLAEAIDRDVARSRSCIQVHVPVPEVRRRRKPGAWFPRHSPAAAE